jgi:hypothetical protein
MSFFKLNTQDTITSLLTDNAPSMATKQSRLKLKLKWRKRAA